MTVSGKPPATVWYQNAAFVWIPLMVVGAVLAWTMLKSVPVKANIRQQFDIFRNQDTWWMTILYIMTFGTFSGLAAQFGLLMANLYGSGNTDIVQGSGASATVLIAGYAVPDAVKYVFLGPLIGAAARVVFAPLTDRTGGAVWTLVSGIGLDRLDRLHDPRAHPGHQLGGHARRRLQPVPLRDARDLPVRRHRQRLDLQADADDLRAPPGRRGHRVDGSHRGLRTVLLRRRRDHPGPGGLLLDRHRLGRHVRRHHLVALRPTGCPQAGLTLVLVVGPPCRAGQAA